MNKKLLLLAMPAIMILSSCGARIYNQEVEKQPELEMHEDNLAHEEIFGVSSDTHQLIKSAPLKAVLTSDFVKIGYQMQFNANGEGTADDKISIRFIAALKGEVASASWQRGLAQPNGVEGVDFGGLSNKFTLGDGITHNSTVFYDALNNGGDRIAANAGEFVGYDRFAIYTLLNIPYESYKNSYLAAYVELTSDNTIKSQALAVKIESYENVSTNAFTFDPTVTGHFLQGKINNISNSFVRATENPGGSNFAAYYSLQLLNTDSFGSFYFKQNENFQFFGFSDYFVDQSKYNEASLTGYACPKASGTYNLYLSSDDGKHNHVYTDDGHIWTIALGSGDPVGLSVQGDGGAPKYFIENVSVTAGESLHIYKDGVEDSSVYSVKENVSKNNIYTGKTFKNSGTCNIYLNVSGGIWVSTPDDAYQTININLGKWNEASAPHYYAWAWNSTANDGDWYELTITTLPYATLEIPNHCDSIKLTRSGNDTPSWDCYNETGNITIKSGTLEITGWHNSGDSGPSTTNWD